MLLQAVILLTLIISLVAAQSSAIDPNNMTPEAKRAEAKRLESEITSAKNKIGGLLQEIDSMVKAKYYTEQEIARLKEAQGL